MGRLFGTDGVRGLANKELTPQLAFEIGRVGAYVLSGEVHHKPRIVVGKDTRISGDMLEAALVSGLCSVGAEVELLGVIPTPAVAYLVRNYGADAGVMISASHNPYEFNGIKFFDSKGYKLPDAVEERIEAIILDNSEELPEVIGNNIGRCSVVKNSADDYMKFLNEAAGCNLEGIKIGIDCSNGVTYEIAPKLFARLGADVKAINNKPDGININDKCGSTHLEVIRDFVVENNLDIGLAFDGDADRLLAVDEKGQIVDGDKIMAICGGYMRQQGKLKKNAIVATVMSNLGLGIFAKKEGIKVYNTKVGDRYVLEKMVEEGISIGGEQSGHIIFLDLNTTGDGMLTALTLLSVLKKTGRKLSEAASVMDIYPQVLINAKVSNDKKNYYMEDNLIANMVNTLESEFKEEGRVLIRPSGTEPLVRVMIEGKDIEYIEQRARELAAIIEERLG
ncbi:MAG: phosphoglucosamine mutase [Deltaproteobacteria bacterium]